MTTVDSGYLLPRSSTSRTDSPRSLSVPHSKPERHCWNENECEQRDSPTVDKCGLPIRTEQREPRVGTSSQPLEYQRESCSQKECDSDETDNTERIPETSVLIDTRHIIAT